MVRLEVRLLGRPTVLIDGTPVPPPRGAKAWGLLAYLANSGRSHPRSELAELLFGAADDPLGALRWSLAALRRLLDRPDALKGDAIGLDLPEAVIDTRLLEGGDPAVLDRPESGADLLSGLGFPDSPVFELWLAGERRRLGHRSASLLREATLSLLAHGDYVGAIGAATRLVAIDALDEGHHALLIRAHALAGDATAARQQFDRCRALLRQELSVDPGAAVIAAVHLANIRGPGPDRHAGGPDVDARIAVAWQSFLGGAVDHGIDLGRSATAAADREGDAAARITARLFLGGMLSMAVRGWDECAVAVTEALHLARTAGLAYEEATARAILAGTELMRADYQAATQHATLGGACCDEPGAIAFNLTFLAATEADRGSGVDAVALAVAAAEAAETTGDPIRVVYASSYAGHALLLQQDPVAARPHVERAIDAAASMLVLRPWPMAMLAEIDVATGRLDEAFDGATRAAALAATTDIAYQRALAQRAFALGEAARRDTADAVERLTDALHQARRTTGEGYGYHWPVAWVLESLATVSAELDPAASRRWASTLLDHATATGMAGFVARAERLLAPSGAPASV